VLWSVSGVVGPATGDRQMADIGEALRVASGRILRRLLLTGIRRRGLLAAASLWAAGGDKVTRIPVGSDLLPDQVQIANNDTVANPQFKSGNMPEFFRFQRRFSDVPEWPRAPEGACRCLR